MSAVAGLRGTGNFATDERPKDFREMILWRRPNGTAPMTALLSKANKSKVADPEFNWWDETVDIIRLRVNKSGDYGVGDTTIVVDSSDPDTTTPNAVWGLATHLVEGDVLQVEPASSATEVAGYTNELILVTGVNSATEFTVQRGFAGTSAAAIVNDQFLLHIGSAFGEGRNEADATSRNPTKYTNYCQIFKTGYSVTKTATRVTNYRTGDVLKNEKMRRSSDHSKSLEHALMWGIGSEGTDPVNGKILRTSKGLRSFIPSVNTTIFATPVTVANFLTAASVVFDYESPSGDERIVFGGNKALNKLNSVIKADTNSRINFNEKITVYGMKLNSMVLPQGTLYFKSHPLMNRHAIYSDSLFIVDFAALRWRHTKGGDTFFEDNIQNKGEDQIKGQWYTEGGLEVFYGGLTCAYIGNVSST